MRPVVAVSRIKSYHFELAPSALFPRFFQLLNDLFAIKTGSTAKFNDHNRKRYSN